jgi:glycosyltransferase involved in cell wall biosynthesis
MSDKAAVFWYSNSARAKTGYGEQTKQVVSRLIADGHDVGILENYGMETGAPMRIDGALCYPRGNDLYSNDIFPSASSDFFAKHKDKANLIFTLYDVWVLKNPAYEKMQFNSWTPLDHEGIPPHVLDWLNKPNVKPIAMSQHGHDLMKVDGIMNTYIPHAIEKDYQYTPVVTMPNGDQKKMREVINVPEDAFLVFMNAANKGQFPLRKSFGEAIVAFAEFAKKNKDAVLYIHTDVQGTHGIPLMPLFQKLNIQGKVFFPSYYTYFNGLSRHLMAGLYSAADVLLMPSMGEGFGVPAIESQACGTRVIVSNCSAQPELVGDGFLVDGQRWWNPTQNQFLFTPFIHSIVDKLQQAYDTKVDKSDKAIEFAKQFDADFVYETKWKPLLSELIKNKGKKE